MTKKFKQLFTMLLAVAILVTGFPAMEAKAAGKTVTIATATQGTTEYSSGMVTVSAGWGASNGLMWTPTSGNPANAPYVIKVEEGYTITKIVATIGGLQCESGITAINATPGDVAYTLAVDNTITITDIDADEVTLTPEGSGQSVILWLKEFKVTYTGGNDNSTGSCSAPAPKKEAPAEPPTPAEELRAAEEEALPLAIVETDKNQVAKDDTGIVPDKAYNLSAYVTTKGFVSALNKIAKANAEAKSVSIYTGKAFTFNKGIVEAINKGGKEVVYYFKHAGHIYSVTVPANVDAAKVLEVNGHAGPLYVGKVLGTTSLVK
ncbi:MAG: hypothetical protein MJ134_07280 [Lachnospiraceae bacterium]|nr:hypothetical protein [Lachnospiraceae bacterium]